MSQFAARAWDGRRSKRSTRSTRLGASIVIAAAVIAYSMVGSTAAPPGPSASADNDGATSAALGVPGTLTVSQSSARRGYDPSWSAASVAGTSVIGKGSAGWTGELAAAGPAIDELNVALCPSPIALDASTDLAVCAALLPSYADAFSDGTVDQSQAGGSLAQLGAAAVNDDGTLFGGGVDLLPSAAAESGSDCPMSSSLAGLLTLALGDGISDIQRWTLGLVEARTPDCPPPTEDPPPESSAPESSAPESPPPEG